jgi:hypothetical protein
MNALNDEELDRIFAAFCEDRQSPAPRPLTAWIAERPDLSTIFTHWATEEASISVSSTHAPSAEFESRSVEIGRAVWARLRVTERRSPAFSSLNDAARNCGTRPREVAQQAGIGMTLFAKLNRRLIDAATIPDRLIERLAAALAVAGEDLKAYLGQAPTLAEAASYRAAEAPIAVGGQPFADALRDCSDMTDDHKREWM